jgi:hypothetical protein
MFILTVFNPDRSYRQTRWAHDRATIERLADRARALGFDTQVYVTGTPTPGEPIVEVPAHPWPFSCSCGYRFETGEEVIEHLNTSPVSECHAITRTDC